MKRYKTAALLFLCLAAVSSLAQQGAPAPAPAAPPPASGTVAADWDIRVYWEPSSHPPDIGRLLTHRFSKEVAGKVGEPVLGVSPDVVMRAQIGTSQVKVEQNSFHFTLVIRLDPPRPGVRPTAKELGMRLAARELADALTAQLSSLLEQSREHQLRPLLESAQRDAAEAEAQLDQLRDQITGLEINLRQTSGRIDASPHSIQAAATRLEDERQRLELDLAGMEARLDEVQRAHDRVSKQVEQDAGSDPVLGELERALATREKLLQVARRRVEAGIEASQKEVAQAEAAYIDVKVQLLERRANAAAARAGGASLAALTQQLQELAIDIRDRKARLKYVNERLKPLRDTPELIARYQHLESGRQSRLRLWEDAELRLRTARRQAQGPPTDRVVVVDAQDMRPEGDEGKP